jgi:hypothetical protein
MELVGEIVGDFGMWFEILRSSKWSWRFWNVIGDLEIIKWSWRSLEILECSLRS